MEQFYGADLSSGKQSEQDQRRCQQVLKEVREALAYSEKLESAMQDAIRASSGLSRQQLEKKIAQTFGEPSERDMYMAKKALQELVPDTGSKQTVKAVRRPFVVNNPI